MKTTAQKLRGQIKIKAIGANNTLKVAVNF